MAAFAFPTRRCGTITVAAERQFQGGRDFTRSIVTDTGIGTTREQSARLLRPFVQADRTTQKEDGATGLAPHRIEEHK